MTPQEVIDIRDEVIDYLRLIVITGGEDNGESELIVKLEQADRFLRRRGCG